MDSRLIYLTLLLEEDIFWNIDIKQAFSLLKKDI